MIFPSNKIRVEIVLPLVYYNDKTQIEPGKFLETRRELTAKFGGCTASKNKGRMFAKTSLKALP